MLLIVDKSINHFPRDTKALQVNLDKCHSNAFCLSKEVGLQKKKKKRPKNLA